MTITTGLTRNQLPGAIKTLRGALKLLQRRNGWCKGSLTDIGPRGVKQYCAVGAIGAVAKSKRQKWNAESLLNAVVTDGHGWHSISVFNDFTDTTKQQVTNAFRRAIAVGTRKLRG